MREMTAKTLKHTLQETINSLKKQKAETLKDEIAKSKAIAYLVSVSSHIVDQDRTHDYQDKTKRDWEDWESDILKVKNM